MSLLDDIGAELAQLSDEDLAKAAAEIQVRRDEAKARMTPERAQKMRDREAKRRALQSAILKAAKDKGLLTPEAIAQAAAARAAAEGAAPAA